MKPRYDLNKAHRGPLVPRDPRRTRVTIWLDTKLIDYLASIVDRAGGGSYEDLINEMLWQRTLFHEISADNVKGRTAKTISKPKLLAALEILDRTKAPNRPPDRKAYQSGPVNGVSKRVRTNEKTHGARAVRRFDVDS